MIVFFAAPELYAQITVSFPTPSSVFQRDNANQSRFPVHGQIIPTVDYVEARLVPMTIGQGQDLDWSRLATPAADGYFTGLMTASGGWYRLDVRAIRGGQVVAIQSVEPMGIGEVFAVAGQSNGQGIDNRDAADPADTRVICIPHLNKTDTLRMPLPGRARTVSATTVIGPRGLTSWCWGRLGDRLAARLNVPVLFMNSAWSGTAVRNWRESITADSTATSYNEYFRPGMPYGNLKRILQDYVPLLGIRAVLWHQGEAEFYDTDPAAPNYYSDLETVIRQSRQDAGFSVPWVIARASMDNNLYANYGLTHYDPVVSAQNRIVQTVANTYYGPDTDIIQMPRTDGVHFSGPGLIQLGDAWNDYLNDDFFRNALPRLPQNVDLTDLSLTMTLDRSAVQANQPAVVTLLVRNDGPKPATQVRVRAALPAGLTFLSGTDLTHQRGVVLTTLPIIEPGATVLRQFSVVPSQQGAYELAGEIVSAAQLDLDSRPNTSPDDGQDDAARVVVRLGSGPQYTVPASINAEPLPAVASNQPAPDPARADISLDLKLDRLTAVLNQPITLSLVVTNRGGQPSGSVQIGCLLPASLQFVDGQSMSMAGTTARGAIANIPAGSSTVLTMRVQAVQRGTIVLQAQVESASVSDPDSIPNNGFANGEDDCAQALIRAGF
ncbi:sialate O-acetylesterase [Spirosoma luteolum]